MELASALAFQAHNFGSRMSADARQQTWREAMALATQAHGIDPGNPEYFRVVAFHSTAHGDSAAERRAAEELMRVRPKWAYPYNVLGVSYMRAGEFDKAVELLKEAVALTPARAAGSDVFSLNLCRAYFGGGNYKAAIESCGKVITKDPSASGAHFLLTMAYALDGDLVRARAEAAEVRRLTPGRKFEADKMRAEAAAADPPRRIYLETKVIPALNAAGLLE